jgi:hypothetical protein
LLINAERAIGMSFEEYTVLLSVNLQNAGEISYVAKTCRIDNRVEHYALSLIDSVSYNGDVQKRLLSSYRDSTKNASEHFMSIAKACFTQRDRMKSNVAKMEEILIDLKQEGQRFGVVGNIDSLIKSIFK